MAKASFHSRTSFSDKNTYLILRERERREEGGNRQNNDNTASAIKYLVYLISGEAQTHPHPPTRRRSRARNNLNSAGTERATASNINEQAALQAWHVDSAQLKHKWRETEREGGTAQTTTTQLTIRQAGRQSTNRPARATLSTWSRTCRSHIIAAPTSMIFTPSKWQMGEGKRWANGRGPCRHIN